MPIWSHRLIVACLLSTSACGDPEPPPATDDSSTGPDPTTGVMTTTMSVPPNPSTTALDSSSGGESTSTSDGSTSTSAGSSSGDSSSSGGDSSSSGDGTSSSGGDTSSSSGSTDTGGGSTGGGSTGGDPCEAGDGPDFAVGNNGFADYVINGVNDPPLTVVRGCSYTFNVNAAGHPFFLKTAQVTGVGSAYGDGVLGNGTQNGVITWDVPLGAPNSLFYICQFHAAMTGTITVIDP